MYFKPPKDDEQLTWTRHVASKMRQYGLSQSRLKRLLNNPERQEQGIVEDTIALMQTVGTKKRPTEIWLMYQPIPAKGGSAPGGKKRIITAWRYPGISPKQKIPIPQEILKELEELE